MLEENGSKINSSDIQFTLTYFKLHWDLSRNLEVEADQIRWIQ